MHHIAKLLSSTFILFLVHGLVSGGLLLLSISFLTVSHLKRRAVVVVDEDSSDVRDYGPNEDLLPKAAVPVLSAMFEEAMAANSQGTLIFVKTASFKLTYDRITQLMDGSVG